MLRVVAIEIVHVLPGWQGSKRVWIRPPMAAAMMDEGVLLLDAGRHPAGGRHMLVPWANIRCVELDAEDGYGEGEEPS